MDDVRPLPRIFRTRPREDVTVDARKRGLADTGRSFEDGQPLAEDAQVEAPQIYCMVHNTLAGGSQFTNTADVGGVYDGQWITAADRWVTRVYAPVKPLPRTGY